MSLGCFLTIKSAYLPEAKHEGESLVKAINAVLRKKGLPAYADPETPPDVYVDGQFGRSALDHHGAGCFERLAELARDHCLTKQMELFFSETPPVIYLPWDFPDPIEIPPSGWFRRTPARVVGSAPALLRELCQLAPALKIPIENGTLTDMMAERINDLGSLYEGDTCDVAEDERTVWLVLYEGARLSCEHQVALSIH